MTSAQVIDSKGKKVREVGLDESVFGLTPNEGLLHSALIRQLANARRGSANTKTRAEVSGGGKKPWRQKGTGRARAGSIRSPLWEGGGVIFGPKPRDYSITMPKKQRLLAIKSALSARREDFVVVESFDALVKDGKTKEFAAFLKGAGLEEKKVLLVLEQQNSEKVERAARNIWGLTVVSVGNLNVKDLLNCHAVLTAEPVLEAISNRFKPAEKSEKDAEKGAKKTKKSAEAGSKTEKPKAKAAPKKAAAEGKGAKAAEKKAAPKAPKAKKAE
ncbi:MAG TPA: 50S ribosomal protein L4 [Planktothrix sp.]|jgi:large subunit ribosomal protein L4